jgi:hypothetical protein
MVIVPGLEPDRLPASGRPTTPRTGERRDQNQSSTAVVEWAGDPPLIRQARASVGHLHVHTDVGRCHRDFELGAGMDDGVGCQLGDEQDDHIAIGTVPDEVGDESAGFDPRGVTP